MRLAFPLVAALLLVSGCDPALDRGGFGEAPPPANTPTSEPQAADADRADLVRVSALGGLAYDPALLEIKAGRTTDILFTNRDAEDHTLVVSELALAMLAGPGQTVRSTVELSRAHTGRFAFFCTVPGHRAGGMEGTLFVSRE